ncbi:polysaccharide biosynthesis/export family protein [Variovorax humicola]|uniref:Polysaccharide biosynthesis/export family protein n=1 Tax=Variovorax humicola TaxID=1769758 RepID=A0ABU8VSN9_9BURK
MSYAVEPGLKRNFLHAVLLAAVGALLGGCTIAPSFDSMRYGENRPVNTDMKLGAGPDGDQPPDGFLTEITPDLIRIQNKARVTAVPADVQALIGGEPEPYRLGAGDVIGITVFDHPELVFSGLPSLVGGGIDTSSVAPAPGFIVNDAGNLTFPYAGTLKASGMTVQELERTLTQRLSRVFKDPQVSVRVASFRSKRAYVDGEVRTPGLLVFTDIAMTLPEAINRAGGLATTGDRSYVTLTRNGRSTRIDLNILTDAGVDPSRILLRNGDMINVRAREESKVTVMGEVNVQGGVLMRNGRLTLNDALTESGGLNLGTSAPRQIYVIRGLPEGGQTVFHLDARTASAIQMADGFPLKAKDVVFVDPVPLVVFSRVANLVLVSANTATAVRNVPRN